MSDASLTVDQHREALAANLPTGKIWRTKWIPSANLFKLLDGLAPSFFRMDEFINRYQTQALPFTTEDYLPEWEETLFIPDDCIGLSSDADIRRLNIGLKLLLMRGVQTRPDFQGLANFFGFTDYLFHSGVEHMPRSETVVDTTIVYPEYLPVLTIAGSDFANIQDARNTLVVVEGNEASISFGDVEATTGWQFPLSFAAEGQVALRCIIEKVIPANTRVIFVEGV